MDSIIIRLFQLRPKSKEENIETMKILIRQGGFNIGIFPELYLSGYLLRDDINLYKVKREDIKILQENMSDDMLLIFGAPEYDQFLYNSAFVVDRYSYSTYRKMFLPNFGPFEEKRNFKEGNKPFAIEFMNFKINVEICYDLFFDEPLVTGSDIIINISASPFTSRSYFEKVFPSIAVKKQAYFIYLNTTGLQRNLVFWGGSRVLSPDGDTLIQLQYFNEEIKDIEVGKSKLEEARFKRKVVRDELSKTFP